MTNNGWTGILLCTVQGSIVLLPNGVLLEPAVSCDSWTIVRNSADNNFFSYLVIDGAHHNLLSQNSSSNASVYDIEMTSESQRFGFTTPTSYNNTVISLGRDMDGIVIKVCGEDNVAYGGQQVDLDEDPCW